MGFCLLRVCASSWKTLKCEWGLRVSIHVCTNLWCYCLCSRGYHRVRRKCLQLSGTRMWQLYGGQHWTTKAVEQLMHAWHRKCVHKANKLRFWVKLKFEHRQLSQSNVQYKLRSHSSEAVCMGNTKKANMIPSACLQPHSCAGPCPQTLWAGPPATWIYTTGPPARFVMCPSRGSPRSASRLLAHCKKKLVNIQKHPE